MWSNPRGGAGGAAVGRWSARSGAGSRAADSVLAYRRPLWPDLAVALGLPDEGARSGVYGPGPDGDAPGLDRLDVLSDALLPTAVPAPRIHAGAGAAFGVVRPVGMATRVVGVSAPHGQGGDVEAECAQEVRASSRIPKPERKSSPGPAWKQRREDPGLRPRYGPFQGVPSMGGMGWGALIGSLCGVLRSVGPGWGAGSSGW